MNYHHLYTYISYTYNIIITHRLIYILPFVRRNSHLWGMQFKYIYTSIYLSIYIIQVYSHSWTLCLSVSVTTHSGGCMHANQIQDSCVCMYVCMYNYIHSCSLRAVTNVYDILIINMRSWCSCHLTDRSSFCCRRQQ